MAGQGIDYNNLITGILALFALGVGCNKIYQIFIKPTKVEIEKNKEAAEKAEEHTNEKIQYSEDIVKLLISANEKYFNEKFDAQNARFDTFSKDIKKIVDKHDDKIDTHSEILTRHDERLASLEKSNSGMGARLTAVENMVRLQKTS